MSYPKWFFYITFRDGYEDTYEFHGSDATAALLSLTGEIGYGRALWYVITTHGGIVKIELVEPKEKTDA